MTFLVLLLIGVCCTAAETLGAEFEFHPGIAVREEYNDNLFLSEESKEHEFITRVLPSVEARYAASLWTWDLKYTLDYIHYARNLRGSETLHHLNLSGLIEPVKGKLFVKVIEEYGRVSLDITRDFTRESTFARQSDRNFLSVNPYYVFRLSPVLTVTAGYIFADTRYDSKAGVDKTDHTLYVESAYDVSRYTSLTAGYKFVQEDSERDDFLRHDVYVGARHEYADKSFITLRIGNSLWDYDTKDSNSQIFWSAGLTHNFRTFTGFLETGVDYYEDPQGTVRRVTRYLAGIKALKDRAELNLSAGATKYKDEDTELSGTSDRETKYGATGTLKYELTPKMTGFLDLTVERIEHDDADTHTKRFLGGLKLDYLLWENTVLSLSYYYTDSSSPDIPGDNYENNRVFAEVKKRF
ncbi:MAG: TIGR03016 family PEP-CTERM system-associated outer membrane protein [Nitrospirota bacterium]